LIGQLHLHPISETYQFRPTLTYMDVLSSKGRRRAGEDSDSDDGPPPDPDDPTPLPVPPKKEKKIKAGEAKEVSVSARKSEDKSGMQLMGGLSTARREMLAIMRAEEDEVWEDLEFCDGEVKALYLLTLDHYLQILQTEEAGETFEKMFSHSEQGLECKTNVTSFLNDIVGL
jgi:DNA-directed RNA polymerase-3 subunit RPC5